MDEGNLVYIHHNEFLQNWLGSLKTRTWTGVMPSLLIFPEMHIIWFYPQVLGSIQ
jgi:hypothetical protein